MTKWKDGMPDEWGYDRYGDSPEYQPEKYDLKILVSYDWAGSWEFDMVMVWQHLKTGEVRGAYDSGCSCPSPFGDLTWDGMKPINEVDDLRNLVDNQHDEGRFDKQDEGVAKLKAAVHQALSEQRQVKS